MLPESELIPLIAKAKEIFKQEPNCLRIRAPVTICGDTHGQFYDLMELFKMGGEIPNTNYLFLGDYVDRGFHSVEVITLLVLLKVRYKDRIHLIRGNHESRSVTQVYGFYDECIKKYGSANMWKQFTDLFDFFPVSALVANKVMCMHGGLSPSLEMIDELNDIDRFTEIPHEGCICDLVWSDPNDQTRADQRDDWKPSDRGAGYYFNEKVLREFNHRNGLDYICRAHQVAMNGFYWTHGNQCVTVFSAPNYSYRQGNDAAIFELDENMKHEALVFFKHPDQTGKMQKATPDYYL